jgi:hypothetical protein
MPTVADGHSREVLHTRYGHVSLFWLAVPLEITRSSSVQKLGQFFWLIRCERQICS